jgi:hypothetical protein
MLHVLRVWQAVSRRADNFSDNERSLPRGGELVHAVSLLDAPEDEVTNVKGGFLNVAVVIASKLFIMMGLSHDCSKSLCWGTW